MDIDSEKILNMLDETKRLIENTDVIISAVNSVAEKGFSNTSYDLISSEWKKTYSNGICDNSSESGITIGISEDTIKSYDDYKNGDISVEEYLTSLAQNGINQTVDDAVSSGLLMPLSLALGATPVASFPVSVLLGKGIKEIFSTIINKLNSKDSLKEAKYYQNIMHSHDDLISAISKTEIEFGNFINSLTEHNQEYEKIKDINIQLNGIHSKANQQLNGQYERLNSSLKSLNSLINKI